MNAGETDGLEIQVEEPAAEPAKKTTKKSTGK